MLAPATELPGDAVSVATAIAALAEAATPEERRHQLEDLVDLQAFVPDPPLTLRPPAPTGSDVVGVAADPLLESIRWRQASLIAFAMNQPSVIGDHVAIRGRWTAIGDARAAIDLVNNYREWQAGGIAALVAWPIGALIGFGLANITANARPAIAAIVILGVSWVAAPVLGGAVGLLEARIGRSAIKRSHPSLIGRVEVAFGLGAIVLVPVLIGAVVTILVSQLGWP